MLRRVVWFFLLAFAAQAAAWAGQIRGRVRYPNGAPASYVRVEIHGDAISYESQTTTDEQGKFLFDQIAKSTFRVTIDIAGFYSITRSEDISMSGMADEDMVLRPKEGTPLPEPPSGTIDARVAAIPKAASKEFETGQTAMDAKDLLGAIAHFQKAIDLYPRYAEAYQLLGLAQLQSNQAPQAEASLVKALEIEDKMPRAQYLLGMLYAMTGRANLAEKPFTRFAELDPQNPDAHFELARVSFALNKFPDSEAQARKAIELKEVNAGVHMVLAYALLRQNKPMDAKKEFEAFLKLDPNGPAAPDVKNTIAMIEQHEKK
jgi:tetratricopeptide (TPR) repeat protein